MHLGFAGSPEFAATILRTLIESDFAPQIVFTQPPRKAGRGRRVRTTPVQSIAEDHGIPVHSFTKLREKRNLFEPLDLLVVAAYGLILPQVILDSPRLGCLNVHASLLPRWRGASPVEYAILHGDCISGVSIMKVEAKLDAGPIYQHASLRLNGTETTESLTNSLAHVGAKALLDVLGKFSEGTIACPVAQDPERVTYAPRLDTNAAQIHWEKDAFEIERQVRAFIGRSPAFTVNGDIRLRILKATPVQGSFRPGEIFRKDNKLIIGCGRGGLSINEVQLNKGKGTAISIGAAINGYPEAFREGNTFE